MRAISTFIFFLISLRDDSVERSLLHYQKHAKISDHLIIAERSLTMPEPGLTDLTMFTHRSRSLNLDY